MQSLRVMLLREVGCVASHPPRHSSLGIQRFTRVSCAYALSFVRARVCPCLQKHSFFRERARGYYSTGPYFASKIVVDLVPLRIVPPIHFSLIVYYLIGLNDGPARQLSFIVTMVLVNVVAAAGTCVCFCSCTWLVKLMCLGGARTVAATAPDRC